MLTLEGLWPLQWSEFYTPKPSQHITKYNSNSNKRRPSHMHQSAFFFQFSDVEFLAIITNKIVCQLTKEFIENCKNCRNLVKNCPTHKKCVQMWQKFPQKFVSFKKNSSLLKQEICYSWSLFRLLRSQFENFCLIKTLVLTPKTPHIQPIRVIPQRPTQFFSNEVESSLWQFG